MLICSIYLCVTLTFGVFTVWEPGEHPGELDQPWPYHVATKVLWHHRENQTDEGRLPTPSGVEVGWGLVCQPGTQVGTSQINTQTSTYSIVCENQAVKKLAHSTLYCSMMFDTDAGHSQFLEDVYECQSRMPGGHWGAATVPWSDVVSSRNSIPLPSAWVTVVNIPLWQFTPFQTYVLECILGVVSQRGTSVIHFCVNLHWRLLFRVLAARVTHILWK